MNDAYTNMDPDTRACLEDLKNEHLEEQMQADIARAKGAIPKRELIEAARQYAETKMWPDWDRKSDIGVSSFYCHMLDYIQDNFWLIPKVPG